MSQLVVFKDDAPETPVLQTRDPDVIADHLKEIGVRFERWEGPVIPARDATEEEVLAVYRPWLDQLMGETGAGSADVIRIDANTPNLPAIREKFLSEHIHSEDEIRFFVHGSGHFVLHVDGSVFDVCCTQSDVISVPEGIKHWFDAGLEPDVVALRVFTDKTGWIAQYTGDDVADRFPVTPPVEHGAS